MNIFSHFIFLIISLSCSLLYTQVISLVVNHERARTITSGAIFGETSRSGKEAKLATEMVVYAFHFISNQSLLLYFEKSRGKPGPATLEGKLFQQKINAAKNVISTNGVSAILGANKRDGASAIAEAASDEAHYHVSEFQFFMYSIPTTTTTFPWVLQATPSQQVQMSAIAAIIQSWGLHQVTLISENAPTLSSPKSILSQELQQSRGELSQVYTPTLFSHNLLRNELNQIKKQKDGVFVIPATLGLGYRQYQLAKKLNMTEVGYAWITTLNINKLFHSISPKKMPSVQDIIGTKTYFPENSQISHDFWKGIWSNFRNIHPGEPGIFASQAYDPVQALFPKPDIRNLFQRISAADFGVELQFIKWKGYSGIGEFVNFIGKTHHSWYVTKDFGLPETISMPYNFDSSNREYNDFVKQIAIGEFDAVGGDVTILKERRKYAKADTEEVYIRCRLPIHTQQTERRRRILTSRSEPIRVGVPAHSMHQQYVKVETDPKTNVTSYDGFSLKVFEEAMNIADVNNDLQYNYYPFDGGHDDLVKQIALGKFDVVVGDVTILEERHKYADFSQAYTESGMVLVVPIRSKLPIQMWLFMNPFTTELWGLIVAITIYNGFIVWLIERNHNPEFRSGTVWNQIGTLFWPASTTLFTLSADKLHSNLSKMVMVVWLFVALILTQSYTSILSDMLTAQRLAPATKDVATLKKMNATVGYCRGSFLKSYMINALGFDSAQIKKYSSTSASAKALKTGEIAGIFLEVPCAKLFLSQYCKSFMRTEKIFKVGGYGFAFKKSFPLLPDINKAILKISENGKLLELEERYINSKKCAEPVLSSNEDASINLDSFAILFVLTGCTSTLALAIYVIRYIICFLYSTPECSDLFKSVSAFTKRWIKYSRPSSAIFMSSEHPGNTPDAPYSDARQPVCTTFDTESLEDHPEAPGPVNKV